MKRNTIQRSLVLKTVRELKSHPTVDEVYTAATAEHPTISKGTVYRNLNQLAEEGEIRKMDVPAGVEHYDHCCHEHYHVRCLKCGRIYDVDMDYIPHLERAIKDAHGFEFSGYDLMFKGVCAECRCKEEIQAPH
nr:transcriptional repressor [uncultured Acetatifactor sp.]